MAKMNEQPLEKNLSPDREQAIERPGLGPASQGANISSSRLEAFISEPEDLIQLYTVNRGECVYKLIHLFFDLENLTERFEQILHHTRKLPLNNIPEDDQYVDFAKFLIWAVPSDEPPIPLEVLEGIIYRPYRLLKAAKVFFRACKDVDVNFLLGENGGPEAYQKALEEMDREMKKQTTKGGE